MQSQYRTDPNPQMNNNEWKEFAVDVVKNYPNTEFLNSYDGTKDRLSNYTVYSYINKVRGRRKALNIFVQHKRKTRGFIVKCSNHPDSVICFSLCPSWDKEKMKEEIVKYIDEYVEILEEDYQF